MADGTAIRLRRHGNPAGPRIVLSHANGLAADAYYPFWSLLTDRFDVVVYDFRNHGWNAVGALEAHAIPTFVDDMTRVARAIGLRFGKKPAIGVFHSLSGQTAAIEACSGARSFAALVLFDPFNLSAGVPPGPQGPPEENHGPDGRRGAAPPRLVRVGVRVRGAVARHAGVRALAPRGSRPAGADDAAPGERRLGVRPQVPAGVRSANRRAGLPIRGVRGCRNAPLSGEGGRERSVGASLVHADRRDERESSR